MNRIILGISAAIILIIFESCSTQKKLIAPKPNTSINKPEVVDNKEDAFFIDLFKKYPGLIDSVVSHSKEWNIQIIYTQINRNRNGIPELEQYHFNRTNARYFYPASTVKLPVSLLAMEKLNKLNIPGLNKYSTMITNTAYSGQSAVYNDPNTKEGKPSIAQYIKKIMLVSDNDAYNRLYEFLGQEYINESLHSKGYASAEILHRLDIYLSEDENRHTNPVQFYDSNNNLIYSQPMQVSKYHYAKRNDWMGKAYFKNDVLINEPMDFSKKNRIELADLNQVLISLVFPQAVPASQRFNITEDDRRFVLKYMSALPSESVYPSYDSSYHDAYAKFILFGASKGTAPKNVRIFNKVGDAYGQLIDVAYIVDFDKKIEFMLSAVIYCNQDGTLNDDKYDYENIGLPFMKNLGKIFYNYEVNRKRNYQPDLSSFIFKYDN